jgi:hypothetical protein
MSNEKDESPNHNRNDVPYPDSLCHGCAAAPRYMRGKHSTFIFCPLLPEKYPAQPVLKCRLYQPRRAGA